ncbi:MAG: fimbrillin family protein [Bacteroidales bacterium]|nr:fimbrillin family protein [Bacteroidales bacterium]
MKKNLIHIFLSLVCGATVLSCAKEGLVEQQSEFALNLTPEVTGLCDFQTKAELIHEDTDITDKTLKLYGWEGDRYWIEGINVNYIDGAWNVPESIKALSTKSYSYLSYTNMPGSGASIDAPSTKDGNLTYTVTDILQAQTDVLLGRYSVSHPTSGDVNLTFSHPYASVKFILGNTNLESVKSVSLTGVYSKGKTTLSQSSAADGDGVVQYTWTGLDDPGNTIEASGLSATTGFVIATFLVIPQDLATNNVVLTITDNNDVKMSKVIKENAWTAGYTTTYTINKIGEIDIEITDQTITNSGEAKIYVRAMLRGAWYDADGNIVAPWNSTDGISDKFPTANWEQSGDIYYCKNALANSDSVVAYTKTTPGAAPVAGATLKIDLLVQAIPFDVNKSCKEAFEAL